MTVSHGLRVGCDHPASHGAPRVVLTGGPGAGKTAVLEVVRRQFCDHVVVLPESATIVFGGGFPRMPDPRARRRAQRAIIRVQEELEGLETDLGRAALVMCDRGLPDGLAYWPDDERSFWDAVGAPKDDVLARYAAVIHLRTPSAQRGYDRAANPIRIETAEEAARIDERIVEAWRGHPRIHTVESTDRFLDKLRAALAALALEVPPCCRRHIAEAASQPA